MIFHPLFQFTTGTNAAPVTPPAVVALGGGRPVWRSETEARARRRSVERFLLQKEQQTTQLRHNVKKLERKKREADEPDLFHARIVAALAALEELKAKIHDSRIEILDIDDYLDQLIDSEEDEDDWLLLH